MNSARRITMEFETSGPTSGYRLKSTSGILASKGIVRTSLSVPADSDALVYEVEVWGDQDVERPVHKLIRAQKSTVKNAHWSDAASRAAQFLCRIPGAKKVQIRDGSTPYATYTFEEGRWVVSR